MMNGEKAGEMPVNFIDATYEARRVESMGGFTVESLGFRPFVATVLPGGEATIYKFPLFTTNLYGAKAKVITGLFEGFEENSGFKSANMAALTSKYRVLIRTTDGNKVKTPSVKPK